MSLLPQELTEICAAAQKAARKAGLYIIANQNRDVEVKQKPLSGEGQLIGGTSLASQVVTEIDKAAQDIILDELSSVSSAYDLGLLTEESIDDGSRFSKDYFWCIDPLDGTLAFIRKEPGYSTSIALVNKAGHAIMGVVYDPVADNMYYAIDQLGAFRNNKKIEPKIANKKFTWVINDSDVKRQNLEEMSKEIEKVAAKHDYSDFSVNPIGGGVMSALWILDNAPACYFKKPKKEKGCGSVWDFAATSCIFNELGLTCTNFDGHPLQLNPQGSTFMNEKGIYYGVGIGLEEIKEAVSGF